MKRRLGTRDSRHVRRRRGEEGGARREERGGRREEGATCEGESEANAVGSGLGTRLSNQQSAISNQQSAISNQQSRVIADCSGRGSPARRKERLVELVRKDYRGGPAQRGMEGWGKGMEGLGKGMCRSHRFELAMQGTRRGAMQ